MSLRDTIRRELRLAFDHGCVIQTGAQNYE